MDSNTPTKWEEPSYNGWGIATDGSSIHKSLSDYEDYRDSGYMMMMYFYFGYDDVSILFKPFVVTTSGGMVGACFAVAFLAVFYEGFKVLREYFLKRMAAPKHSPTTFNLNKTETDNDRIELVINSTEKKFLDWKLICSAGHLTQTCLHMIQFVISYFLMLIFMTYNGYLCIAVTLGTGLGYFAFRWKANPTAAVDKNEHCH